MTGFGIINIHEHINGISCVPKLVEAMRKNDVLRTVLVGAHDPAATPTDIRGTHEHSSIEDSSNAETLRIATIYPEYFIPFVAVDSSCQEPSSVIRSLEGRARGVEICRGGSRTPGSALNNRSLLPLYRFCQRRRVPVIFHAKLEDCQAELEGTLREFPRLKAMCSLLGRSALELERADYLLRTYPNLYTDTGTGEADDFHQTMVSHQSNPEELRTLVLKYQDRILFGTGNIGVGSRKTINGETAKLRRRRDFLEKDIYNGRPTQEQSPICAPLDPRALLKIYCTNAEHFLELPPPKENVSQWGNAGQRRRDLRERVNWSRVSDFITESLARSMPVTEDLLFSLNRLVLEDFTEHRRTRGRYRKALVVIRRMGNVVHIPPRATDIPLLMKQLLSSIDPPPGPSAVGYVARVFLTLQEIHPFHEGNGRTGRALATYMLRQSGFREKRGHSLEQYFDANIEDYYDTLYQSRNGDPLPWLLFFATAVESVMSDKTSTMGALSSIAGRLRRTFHLSSTRAASF